MADTAHTRRGFVAALGTVAVAGCSGLVPREPAYQIVGGVERTLIRGVRDGTNRKVAKATPTNSSVVDGAPTDLAVRTVAYDTAVVDLSDDGDSRPTTRRSSESRPTTRRSSESRAATRTRTGSSC
jgi:hypothetical protein